MSNRSNAHRDLTGSNVVPLLLEERDQIKILLNNAERRLKEINETLKTAMGDADVASLPGWWLEIKRHHRREYTVPAQDVKALYVKRLRDEG